MVLGDEDNLGLVRSGGAAFWGMGFSGLFTILAITGLLLNNKRKLKTQIS
jgi:hypothetical protein